MHRFAVRSSEAFSSKKWPLCYWIKYLRPLGYHHEAVIDSTHYLAVGWTRLTLSSVFTSTIGPQSSTIDMRERRPSKFTLISSRRIDSASCIPWGFKGYWAVAMSSKICRIFFDPPCWCVPRFGHSWVHLINGSVRIINRFDTCASSIPMGRMSVHSSRSRSSRLNCLMKLSMITSKNIPVRISI